MKKRIKIDEFSSEKESNSRNSSNDSDKSQRQKDAISQKKLFPILVFFRIVNACVVRTWFVPDEYWQTPEVAHKLVFGYGYLTWEWKQGLRGYTLPLFFAAAYKVLAVLGIDSAEAVILVPNILQSILAAFGDLFLYKLARKLFGNKAAMWALLCNLIAWFTFYCITRTLSNSCETVLTTIALYYWPLNDKKPKQYENKSNTMLSLIVAALACLVRPTSAIIWVPLCIIHLTKTDKKSSFIFMNVIPVGTLAILWSTCVDSIFYGKLTLVQYNFVVFNVVKDLGTFYGSHPWYWYFSQGFPVVLFTHLPFFIAGVHKAKATQRLLGALVLWVLIIYSCLGHKEFRFIFPVIPLCMCYCGNFLANLTDPTPTRDQASTTRLTKANVIFIFLSVTNIPLALYTSTVHQRGVMDVMKYLRGEVSVRSQPMSVLFLMPCHSTPYYSHIHQNISMRFLECPPSDTPHYIDEADRFYQQPMRWLENEFTAVAKPLPMDLPTHIVLFSVLTKKIKPFLVGLKYEQCSEFFHSHVPEGRIGANVLVYCRQTA